VSSQLWRPTPACAPRAGSLILCAGLVVLLAAPVSGAPISSYNSWQWGGFSRSSSSSAASSSSAKLLAAASAASTSTSALTYSVSGAVFGDGTAKLSGLVYYDEDKDSKPDSSDWAISGAQVTLSMSGSETTLVAYTNSKGEYAFVDLPAGTYSINLNITDSDPGKNVIGKLFDSNGKAVSVGVGTVGADSVMDIVLADGYKGVNYNFTQLAYPVSLITKRLLTYYDPGIYHTVPEPGSMVLLAMAGLCLVGLLARRRSLR